MIPNMTERSIKRIVSVERKCEISQICIRNVHTNVSRAWQGDVDDEQSPVCVLKSLLHWCSKMRSSVPRWNAWECCRVLPFTATVVWTLFLMSVACIFHVFHRLAYFAGSCSSKMKTSVAGCPRPLIRWRPWRRSSKPVDITCRQSWVEPETTWRKWETSSEGQSCSVLALPLFSFFFFFGKKWILLFSKNAFK